MANFGVKVRIVTHELSRGKCRSHKHCRQIFLEHMGNGLKKNIALMSFELAYKFIPPAWTEYQLYATHYARD